MAYCFVPNGVIGTFRTVRLVQQLASEGWSVTVLTGDPASYAEGTIIDHELCRLVPAGTTVVRAGAWRGLSHAARLCRRVRPSRGAQPGRQNGSPLPAARGWQPRIRETIEHLCSIPDDDVGWLLPAVWRGLVAARRRSPDVIYSSAPPWTGHLVGLALARLLRRPWVADFRDPWARAPWRSHKPQFVRRAWAWLEALTVRQADGLLFATRALRDDVVDQYGPWVSSKCHVVRNGCDVDEFTCVTPYEPGDRFTLAHIGSLYGHRDPTPLLRALASVFESGVLDRRSFRLRLIGPVALRGVDLPRACRELGLDDVVEFVPRMSRRESLAAMASASALLLVQPAHPLSVPGKFYEYLAASRPILALTDEGETADLVHASGAGVVVSPSDEEGIRRALVAIVDGGGVETPTEPSLFDGRRRAQEMVSVLERALPFDSRVPITHPRR